MIPAGLLPTPPLVDQQVTVNIGDLLLPGSQRRGTITAIGDGGICDVYVAEDDVTVYGSRPFLGREHGCVFRWLPR